MNNFKIGILSYGIHPSLIQIRDILMTHIQTKNNSQYLNCMFKIQLKWHDTYCYKSNILWGESLKSLNTQYNPTNIRSVITVSSQSQYLSHFTLNWLFQRGMENKESLSLILVSICISYYYLQMVICGVGGSRDDMGPHSFLFWFSSRREQLDISVLIWLTLSL